MLESKKVISLSQHSQASTATTRFYGFKVTLAAPDFSNTSGGAEQEKALAQMRQEVSSLVPMAPGSAEEYHPAQHAVPRGSTSNGPSIHPPGCSLTGDNRKPLVEEVERKDCKLIL